MLLIIYFLMCVWNNGKVCWQPIVGAGYSRLQGATCKGEAERFSGPENIRTVLKTFSSFPLVVINERTKLDNLGIVNEIKIRIIIELKML